MSDIPLGVLVGALLALIAASAFFSGSETGMMALNRYRLRHLARQRHRGALRAKALLERPDRLLGLILLGNNFVNILAASLATLIAVRLLGEVGAIVATFALTAVLLIFAEVAPKTLAALYPERIAFPAALVLRPLLRVLYPVVAGVNWIANGLLRAIGVDPAAADADRIGPEELRAAVGDPGAMLPRRHRRMLLSVLDLERVTIEDIMVPRHEIHGIDLEDSWPEIRDHLEHSQHTRLPLYEGDIDAVVGVLHLRRLLSRWRDEALDKQALREAADEPYFVPEGTPLSVQLLNFQRARERMGLVVDEYGDIRGLVTLEDLLEEIVGEFTTDPADHATDVHPQPDGTFLVDGGATLRELNRTMGWELPTGGPRTLNGLLLEHLESIPEPGTSVRIAGYPIEIVQVAGNAVRTARVKPALRRAPGSARG